MIRIHSKRVAFGVFLVVGLTLYFSLRINPYIGKFESGNSYSYLQNQTIPKTIYQVWKDEAIPSNYIDLQATWRDKNPDYDYKFFTNAQGDEYVEKRFPDIYPLYKRLPIPIMKVDLWRYLIVYDFGGTYTDLDTDCLKPIDNWTFTFPNETVGAIIGVEFDTSNKIVPWFEEVQLEFMQWTFSFAPKHPLIHHVINSIVYKYSVMSDEELNKVSVHNLAGPTMWSEAIIEYLCRLKFCNYKRLQWLDNPIMIDDILILPTTSFDAWTAFRGKGADHPLTFVRHKFFGTWK